MALSFFQSAVMNSVLGYYDIKASERAAEAEAQKLADDREFELRKIREEREYQDEKTREERAVKFADDWEKSNEKEDKLNDLINSSYTQAVEMAKNQGVKFKGEAGGSPWTGTAQELWKLGYELPTNKEINLPFVDHTTGKLDFKAMTRGGKTPTKEKAKSQAARYAYDITDSNFDAERQDLKKYFWGKKGEDFVDGQNVVGYVVPSKNVSTIQATDESMRSAIDMAFRRNYTDKNGNIIRGSLRLGVETNNPELIAWSIEQLKSEFNAWVETDAGKIKVDEQRYRYKTPLAFMDESDYQLFEEVPALLDKFLMPYLDESLGMTRDAILAELGLATGGPASFDEDFNLDVSVNEYGNLAKNYVDPETKSWKPEFIDVVAEIALSSGNTIDQEGGLETEQVFEMLNRNLSPSQTVKLVQTFKKARNWFENNAPLKVQNDGVEFDGSVMANAPREISEVVNYFADPREKLAIIKAMIGSDVIDGLPGKARGGSTTALRSIAKKATGKDVEELGKILTSSTAITEDINPIMELIEEYGVTGGISGMTEIQVKGFVTQARALIEKFSDRASKNLGKMKDANSNQLLEDNFEKAQEALGLVQEGTNFTDQAAAEKLLQALSASLTYSIASMLQGGDFRNISDYDIRMAEDRMGGITGMFTDLQSALPVLRQIKELAMFRGTVARALSTGDVHEVMGAAFLSNDRLFQGLGVDQLLDPRYRREVKVTQPVPDPDADKTKVEILPFDRQTGVLGNPLADPDLTKQVAKDPNLSATK